MSPARLPSGPGRWNEMTSVGRSCLLYSRLSRRIRIGPTKVTDTMARRRSAASTVRTIRRTRVGESLLRPLTRTSGGRSATLLVAAKVSRDPTRTTGILDAGMVHTGEQPGELLAHAVQLPQRERRLPELAGGDLLPDQEIHCFPHPFRSRLIQYPHRGLGAVGEHGDGGFGGPGPRAGILEGALVSRCGAVRLLGLLEEVFHPAGAVVLRDESSNHFGQPGLICTL